MIPLPRWSIKSRQVAQMPSKFSIMWYRCGV